MMIRYECPNCGKTLHIHERYQGVSGKCEFCHGRIRVPGAVPPPRSISPQPTLVAFDTETTGLRPGPCDVIEFAAVKFAPDGTEIDTFAELANPGHSIPSFISDMTGITDRMVRKARPSSTVVREAMNWIGQDSILVAHNASFDLKFVRHHVGEVPHTVVDTLRWARQLQLPTPDNKLPTLLRFIKYDPGSSHRALADARGAAKLVATFLRDHEEPGDPHDIILRYVSGAKTRKRVRVEVTHKTKAAVRVGGLKRRPPDILFLGVRGEERIQFQTLAEECGLKLVSSVTQGLAFAVIANGEKPQLVDKVRAKEYVKVVTPEKFRTMAEYMIQKGVRAPSQVRCSGCKQFMHIPDSYAHEAGKCVQCGKVFSLEPI